MAKKKTKKKVKRAPAKKKPAARKPAIKKVPVKKMAKAKKKKPSFEDGTVTEVRFISTKGRPEADAEKGVNDLLTEGWTFMNGPSEGCPFYVFGKSE